MYAGINYNSILFQGQVWSSKRIYLFYDDVTQHYLVNSNLTGAMAKR